MKFDMLIQLAPAFMIAIHWQGMRAWPTFAGMLVGLFFSLSCFGADPEGAGIRSFVKLSGFNPGLYGLVINLTICIGGSLLANVFMRRQQAG